MLAVKEVGIQAAAGAVDCPDRGKNLGGGRYAGLDNEVKIRYKARKLGLTTVDGVSLEDLSKLDWEVRNKVLEAIDAIEKAPGQKPPVEDHGTRQ